VGAAASQDGSARDVPGAPTAPFFIMGCRRTGTTLVSQILDSHSRLASYHESYFYNILHPELRWYGDLSHARNLAAFVADVREVIRGQNAQPPAADELIRAVGRPTFEGVFDALLRLYAHGRGKARGGDKTPEHHRYLDEIGARFPDSPIVFLMRDPRDTAHSVRRTMDVTLADGARAWNAALLSLRRARARVLLVRYEDLVAGPEAHMRILCEHLGERFEPGMLAFFTQVPDRLKNRRGGEKIDRPVDAAAVGGYRNHLTPREIALVERVCGEGMEELGYPCDGTPPRPDQRVSPALAGARPSLAALVVERLRYYGTNRERWRRGMIRWRMMARARLRWLLRAVTGAGRA
jgi:hypothetical protein